MIFLYTCGHEQFWPQDQFTCLHIIKYHRELYLCVLYLLILLDLKIKTEKIENIYQHISVIDVKIDNVYFPQKILVKVWHYFTFFVNLFNVWLNRR
jgi:hypothetical protein